MLNRIIQNKYLLTAIVIGFANVLVAQGVINLNPHTVDLINTLFAVAGLQGLHINSQKS